MITMTDTLAETLKEVVPWLTQGALRVVAACILLAVGIRLIRWVRSLFGHSMERAGLEITLRKFLDALLYAVLLGLLVFMAAEWIGVKTASIVAMVGAVGLAISLSLQDTIANFAGGCLILFLKPFKVGDYIVTSGSEGTVDTIGLVYTTLLTLDNRRVIIPNNAVSTSVMVNQTGEGKRRLVLDISLSYSSDLHRAKAVLQRLFEESPYMLSEDGILVVVSDLADSGVVLSARGWVRTEDYWNAGWELREKIKDTFDEEGLEFAYPSMDVYVKKSGMTP